jgi:DNA-binding CsgD family transcriptional regulator
VDIELLGDRRTAASSSLDLCGVIGAMGAATFEDAMFAMARDGVRCTHLTAFSFSPHRAPKVMVAANSGNAPMARSLAAKYIQDYWKHDPANQMLESEPRLGSGSTVRLQSHEIENAAYRRDCYRSVDLIDRFSIMKALGNDVVRLNFYREASQGRFGRIELDALSTAAHLLIQIVAKHDSLRPAIGFEDQYDQYCTRLNLSAPQLSGRETQVCAEIVLGMSSESIASKYDLSVNTILSHRRRAYAKLRISSQSELSHMLLQ